MKLLQKSLFVFALVISLLIPQIAIAQTATKPVTTPTTAQAQTDQCKQLKDQIDRAGGSNVTDGLPVYCTTGAVYTKILNFAMYAIVIVAVIAIIYGGYLYMTARGNADQVKKGRAVLTWAIIGLIVVLVAAVIVNAVIRLIVENRFV